MRWNSILSAAPLVLLGISPSSALPNVNRSIIGRAPYEPPTVVYHGDFRSPAKVAEQGGFTSSPLLQVDEQIQEIINKFQRAQAASACQLVGACGGFSFSSEEEGGE